MCTNKLERWRVERRSSYFIKYIILHQVANLIVDIHPPKDLKTLDHELLHFKSLINKENSFQDVIECPYDQGFLNNWIRWWISSIVWELEQKYLHSCKGNFFGIYYFTLPCFKVKYLPIKFIGNYLFEFSPIVQKASIYKRVWSF